MGKHHLPVIRGNAQHHHAEDGEEGAKKEEGSEVACVIDGARGNANDEEQECLDGADPGNVGGRLGAQQVGFVVGLEDAEGIDNSPK